MEKKKTHRKGRRARREEQRRAEKKERFSRKVAKNAKVKIGNIIG